MRDQLNKSLGTVSSEIDCALDNCILRRMVLSSGYRRNLWNFSPPRLMRWDPMVMRFGKQIHYELPSDLILKATEAIKNFQTLVQACGGLWLPGQENLA
jgi:hypothetical protein